MLGVFPGPVCRFCRHDIVFAMSVGDGYHCVWAVNMQQLQPGNVQSEWQLDVRYLQCGIVCHYWGHCVHHVSGGDVCQSSRCIGLPAMFGGFFHVRVRSVALH